MPPSHPAPPTQSSCTTHLVIMNASPRHPEPPTSSSCTTHYVILNLFQDLVSATLDSGSSPDDVGRMSTLSATMTVCDSAFSYAGRQTHDSDWASDRKFGLSGIFQPLRITSEGCLRCAISRFCTPRGYNPAARCAISPFCTPHGYNPAARCAISRFCTPRGYNPAARCAISRFCTPHGSEPAARCANRASCTP